MFGFLSDTYFFTATINNWQKIFCNDNRKNIIIDSLKYCCNQNRISLYAFAIMPNHLHLVLTINENKEIFQRDFLKHTAQKLISTMRNEKNKEELLQYLSSQNDRYLQIWERRPKWIKIDNTIILEQKIEYVHNNPLQQKWKLSDVAENYQWSSASYYTKEDPKYSFITHYLMS